MVKQNEPYYRMCRSSCAPHTLIAQATMPSKMDEMTATPSRNAGASHATDNTKTVIRYLAIEYAPDSLAKIFSFKINKKLILPFPPHFRERYGNLPYRFVKVLENPDLIILGRVSHIDRNTGYFMSALIARWAFGIRPLLLTSIGEPDATDLRECNYVFSSLPPGRTKNYENVCMGIGLPDYLGQWHKYKKSPKTKFCNYVYSNDRGHETHIRRDFCRALIQYKPVDCPGDSLNNMPFPDQNPPEGNHPFEKKLYFIKDYKFTIAFENTSVSGYVTEKISHPLAVGSIPIYHGSPNIADYYNPRAFVNCHDYKNPNEVIDRIQEIDNEPTLYAEYRNAPSVLPHHYYYDMPTKWRKAWSSIAKAALMRRTEKPTLNYALIPPPPPP